MDMWEEKLGTHYSSVHINVTRQKLWEGSTSSDTAALEERWTIPLQEQSFKADGQVLADSVWVLEMKVDISSCGRSWQ